MSISLYVSKYSPIILAYPRFSLGSATPCSANASRMRARISGSSRNHSLEEAAHEIALALRARVITEEGHGAPVVVAEERAEQRPDGVRSEIARKIPHAELARPARAALLLARLLNTRSEPLPPFTGELIDPWIGSGLVLVIAAVREQVRQNDHLIIARRELERSAIVPLGAVVIEEALHQRGERVMRRHEDLRRRRREHHP
jgi:hypothetical protein